GYLLDTYGRTNELSLLPFTWNKFVKDIRLRFVSAYVTDVVRADLEALTLGKSDNLNAFHQRFVELIEMLRVDKIVTREHEVFNMYMRTLSGKMQEKVTDHTILYKEAFCLED